MKIGADFLAATRLLTRLPLPAPAREAGFGAAAFPLVGLLVGAAALAADALAAALAPSIRNVLVLAAWAVLTGAIHYDGLADTLDGLGAADREQRLRVMREAAVGVFAVLGLVLVVAAQLAALGALDGRQRRAALLAAPALGRWAMVLTGAGARGARQEGLGAAFARDVTAADAAVATLAMLASLAILTGRSGWLAFLLAAGAAAGVRRMAVFTLGGVTGDVLGAAGLVAETLALVAFASR